MTNERTVKMPTVGVQAYIPADIVVELDRLVLQDKAIGDKQASRNKLINEAIAEYLAKRHNEKE